jgi:hypothetical protein
MSQMRRVLIALIVTASSLGLSAVAGAATTPTWLCRPGVKPDQCVTSLSTEQFSAADRSTGVVDPKPATHAKFDCFYVYPTVSNETTPVSDLSIAKQPELDAIALYQAARYSQDCDVYAPVYRQGTLTALNAAPGQSGITAQDTLNAYRDVRDAFRYYLAHYAKGRGFVLMGHSQGSFVLRKLIAQEIDPSARLRKQLISAILPGGNVVVKKGGNGEGGDFKHIPICRSDTQLHCVIGWSTFDQAVPADSLFGRIGDAGVTPATPAPGTEILCTNPASLHGGPGTLDSVFPTKPFTQGLLSLGISLLGDTLPPSTHPWVEFPGSYTARCSNAGGANVLQVTAQGGAAVIHPSPTPEWGLHLVDVNLTLGSMIDVVATEGRTWLAGQPKLAKTQ